ncbi:MAG: accessory Sec system protein Asp1 [Lachnospiraceae bacterium]|nr:accessory Sec system protein Asp1 [Lachnospiraceae bacterium]
MLYFIPAWYQQQEWRENEQYWYARRMHTEFDDTVKHIQLFHRSKVHPFQIMLLSFAPNFRHFLHRQSAFRAPYWSCFDAIQEIKRKKVSMFSLHNLNWPEHIEFVYSPFAMIALLQGKKYAQVDFGEDGNLIQVDIYQNEILQRRNIYDDRGFVSSTIVYENAQPLYQDYLTDTGVWKIRHFLRDGHVEVNLKNPCFMLSYQEKEYRKEFSKESYSGLQEVICEVLTAYLELTDEQDMFCVAVHDLHKDMLCDVLKNRKMILSFFGERYDIKNRMEEIIHMIQEARYIITDSQDNLKRIQRRVEKELTNITDITPFDSRVDLGISQQLNVQKILVPIDGMEDEWFEQIICRLGEYLPKNENARVHLFTRVADYGRPKLLLEKVRGFLRNAGMPEEWAAEEKKGTVAENAFEAEDNVPVKFFVEQCVDELSVSKCIREQRLILDMRKTSELYLRITGISMGIPQVIYRNTEFVENEKNGLVLKELEGIVEAVSFYLDNLTNWNEAMVYAYELGKKYTTAVLIEKWKEVIDIVGSNSGITTGD